MTELIERGINKGLITLDVEEKYITYLHQNKKRNYTNPEEKVQADAFLKLVLTYGYPVENIVQFVSITMGASKKEADIIVYNDAEHTQPHIVVECKHKDVSEQEFNQAISQAASYAYALSGTIKFLWVTSDTRDESFLIDKDSSVKQTIPDIPRYGVEKIQKYKYVKGGLRPGEEAGADEVKQSFFELEMIDEDELTRRFKQAHNALWAGGELNPSEAFDELDKLIFCKIWDERKARRKGQPYDFQIFSETIPKNATEDEKKEIEKKIENELYKRILALYAEGKSKDPEVFKDGIRLNASKVKTVVGYLESVNLSETDLDSKGKAFETFMGSYFRGDFGQFFTPRNIVKFIVSVLPITHESKVLDSSCGSGGFLLYALDKVRKEASEYYDEGSRQHWTHWHDFAERQLFGIEINEQIARTAKMNMIIHDDGHTNVISSDGLLTSDAMIAKSGNEGFTYGSFDYIITNPPFGSSVKQNEKAYLHQYSLGNKDVNWLDTANSAVTGRTTQSTEVLFIEQDYNFLKEGGFLAIVLPDGVLTNSSMQYVRDNIEKWFRIVAVVSMPQTAFAHTGAGVKSSVLVLRKWSDTIHEGIDIKEKELQHTIKAQNSYEETIKTWDKERKSILKTHDGFDNQTGETEKRKVEKTPEFIAWKKSINEVFTEKVKNFKEELDAQYLHAKKENMRDYPIFMAIAEDIGFDATGRPTGNNELETISLKLSGFINDIITTEQI
ncbi:MAG: Type I restriction-modification system, DNA-methyltransferase subunit M (EC / Type I restriction-modification system, specificity subunit S (EC [uncultured Sulfurovum sp.]|uniref:Type I restriction-modification system, DNA-methyltransferase subunit M ) n=1 Tax=uncultured Sulfurovum sp. TaxID=269237 RepID=A0A6S6T5R2_9BACT|nr:MAG: Type I restriction-modification system, DNA-methyltransferase subunit M (EC / Type I restriction-modification system, specificity subunit S (EC [uncultured Sulfurovum sp.]